MSEKRYYWIKLKTNFFEQETIDFLMSQKNGCQYIVLYQMLCLKTANTDGKLISKVGEMIVPYDINKIVRDTKYFDFDTVTVALELFKQLGLIYIENEDNTLQIANYEEMVGSETTSAKRVREYRAKQKALQCNNDVTQENREKILDNRVKENREKIKEAWNALPSSIPKIQSISGSREKQLSARIKEYGIEKVIKAIEFVKNSKFLNGDNERGWVITFDWFVKAGNFKKIIEGNYTDRKPKDKLQGKPSFDIAEIERQAIMNDDYDI